MYNIRISGNHFTDLQQHLYPGDGKEAVGIALCGRNQIDGKMFLLVHKIINIPYSECSERSENKVVWSTDIIEEYLPDILKNNWAIIKIHSHPNGYCNFSSIDNKSDKEFYKSIYGWTDNDLPHGSIIMLPDGKLIGRIISKNLEFIDVDRISIVGDDLLFYDTDVQLQNSKKDNFNLRTIQAFGLGTVSLLKSLQIGVIGCSGTGSPLIEQLVRLGVGTIVLIDPDEVEEKNLNRIINSTIEDAKEKRKKVDVLKNAIEKIGIDTKVITFASNLYDDKKAIKQLSACDIIFGCVDSVDGRHLINQLSTFYLISYFDLGVKLVADGNGGISQICGTIHYIQPGGSSLMSRRVFNSEELRAAGLYRTNLAEYEEQRKSGYISNVNVDSPAVISINMFAASLAVNEFLARVHKYRYDPNSKFSATRFSNTDSYIIYEDDGEPDEYLKKFVGKGNISPLLNMIEFSK